jgi:hypothetical protein
MIEHPQQSDMRGTSPTMAPATTPALELNNGVTMPALRLGVYQSPPAEAAPLVVDNS